MAEDKALSLNNGLPAIRNWTKEKFVAKEAGKGLSENNYTAAEKTKLAGIAAGAEVNAQSDWSVTDTGSDAYIRNKPASLPANGGNAATVGGHTVAADVPANAKFTDTTYSVFKAATASAAGGTGIVPAPAAGAHTKYMRGDGTWQTPPNTTYAPATAAKDGLMSKADYAKLSEFQSASSYALKTDIAGVYHYKGSVANESALPTTGNAVGDVYSIEAKSSYGAAGMNVAWKADNTWDNLGGNFTIEYATASEVLAILNA